MSGEPGKIAGRAKRVSARGIRASLRFLALAMLLVAGQSGPGWAAGTAPEQGKPAAASAPAAKASADAFASGTIELLQGTAEELTANLKPILAAGAQLPVDLAGFADRLSDPADGPFAAWLLKLLIVFAVGTAAALLLPHLLVHLRRRVLSPEAGAPTKIIIAFLGDVLGLIVLLAIFYAAHTAWYAGDSPRSAIAVALFGGLIHWRLMMLPVDVLLRPREPEARLVHAADRHAGHMRRLGSWLLGFVAFSHATLGALLHSGVPDAAVGLLALAVGLVNVALALYFVEGLRRALALRPAVPAPSAEAPSAIEAAAPPTLLQRIWHPLALAFILAAGIAWMLGAILENLSVYDALIDTGAILLSLLIIQSVAAAWLTRSAQLALPESAPGPAQRRRALRHRLYRRCLAAALWGGAAVLILEIWIGRLSRILPAEQWQAWRGSVISSALTIYVAYVMWQLVFMHTERPSPSVQLLQSDGSSAPVPVASRIQTMMPVLRIFMLVTIALIAALIALSNLGVNTTSLIAGASIFGLAISFGSQSLVHDIVSGIFFMADDAFRIGEYIDTGKAKGTVEGMSVRSLRLRHQNGQIHVIPFGQIQQVTNFSRDWTTVKFNLSLAIDTDVDRVRKAVKQIGIEMMEDPVLAAELIQPLKMQGVVDIDTNGLVVRLKFTARPMQPTLLQREALKRITKLFREKGIRFASSNVMIQTVTGGGQTPTLPAPSIQVTTAQTQG